MIPSSLEVLDKMPLTANGKRDRRYLEQREKVPALSKMQEVEMPDGILENRLAEIWKSVLRVDKVGRHTTFYEAGGDSLLVAQLVLQLREKITQLNGMEWNPLLSVVLEHPTIDDFADWIERREDGQATDEPSEEPYALLRPADDGADGIHELVLFADGTGTLSIYRELIPELLRWADGHVRISGVSVKNAQNYLQTPEQDLIRALAKIYAGHLLQKKAERYTLIGHCFGGLVAVETARILRAEGVSVEVVMIDSKLGASFTENPLLLERGFGVLLSADMEQAGHTVEEGLLKQAITAQMEACAAFPSQEDLCGLNGVYEKVGACYRKLRVIPQEERLKKLYKAVPNQADTIPSAFEMQHFVEFYQVFCHSYKGVAAYTPDAFDGRLHMLRCEDQSTAFLPFDRSDHTAFVQRIANGSLSVTEIAGGHVSCMHGENAKRVFQVLREILMEDVKDAR